MKRMRNPVIILAALLLGASAAWAASSYTMQPGESLNVACQSGLSGTVGQQTAALVCATLVPTATATMIPPTHTHTPSPAASHDATRWHPPTDHEHGDAPPAWITAAGYGVGFDVHGGFHANTSPAENTAKHAGMKGFAANFNGTDVYFRVHATSNPLDRMARFHSYEVFAKDAAGGISHWQGWYDSGDPTPGSPGRITQSQPKLISRPLIIAVDRVSFFGRGIGSEQWYTTTARWSWAWGWNIGQATTFYKLDENQNPTQENWDLTGPGRLGQDRGLEASWEGNEALSMRGRTFYATQFHQIVSGPNDPVCAAPSVQYGVTYATVCLEQKISATMQAVTFGMPGGNSRSKRYDVTGVKLPN